jgi:hypothetical protein
VLRSSETGVVMDEVVLTDAQLSFAFEAQRSGRRVSVCQVFRVLGRVASAAAVDSAFELIAHSHPALSFRVRFSRGRAFQSPTPYRQDFQIVDVASEERLWPYVEQETETFDGDLDGPALCVRLVRSPLHDYLIVLLDHAFVDELSLDLIAKTSTDGRRGPEEVRARRGRYAEAVSDRQASEAAAALENADYWSSRLSNLTRPVKAIAAARNRLVVVEHMPSVQIPLSFRRPLFPAVLFALHPAVRETMSTDTSIVTFPWGRRNTNYSDVVGCFMNSVVSVGRADHREPGAALDAFSKEWFDDLKHADAPYNAVSRSVDFLDEFPITQLSFRRHRDGPAEIAGIGVVELSSPRAPAPPFAAAVASATVKGSSIHLKLALDQERLGFAASVLGRNWRSRLVETLDLS